MTLLTSVVRDNNGRYHGIGEKVTVLNIVKQSSFDDKMIIKVAFKDGSLGAVFFGEVSGLKQ